jgi:AcrR family transcriptional regulator
MPRGLARDHAAKRDALRRGAAAHFARNGYERASMASVAAACGVSKALIYHYYDSKEALLFDLLHEHLSSLARRSKMQGNTAPPRRACATRSARSCWNTKMPTTPTRCSWKRSTRCRATSAIR